MVLGTTSRQQNLPNLADWAVCVSFLGLPWAIMHNGGPNFYFPTIGEVKEWLYSKIKINYHKGSGHSAGALQVQLFYSIFL